jgi:hypothetical protein
MFPCRQMAFICGQLGQNEETGAGRVLLPTIAHVTPDSVVAIVPVFCGICGGADVPNSEDAALASVVDIVPVRFAAAVKAATSRLEASPSLDDTEPETLGGCVCVPAIEAVASSVVALSLATTALESRSRIGIGHSHPR